MPLTVLLPALLSVSTAMPALPAEPARAEAISTSAEPDTHLAKDDGEKGEKDGKKKKGGGKGKGEKERGVKITAAEFRNSAQTLKKGTFLLHPLFAPSSYAISNKVQLIFPILGQIGGPQVGVRYRLMDKQGQAVAVEPYVASTWKFSSVQAGANFRYTKDIGDNRLNLGAGATVYTTLSEVQATAEDTSTLSTDPLSTGSGLASTNLEIGYDLVVKPKTTWRFLAQTDPYQDAQGTAYAIVGANWNHSLGETFRLSLGLAAYVGQIPYAETLADLGIDLPDLLVLPLPTLELWWKF